MSRSIDHYKDLLTNNPKWLGTQGQEIMQHYIKLEADFYQALEREKALEITLLEAGLEMVKPWDRNGEEQDE